MFPRSPRRAPIVLLLVALCAATAASAQESRAFSVPRAQLGPLETAAQLMARSGWGPEADDLVLVMKTLGYGEQQAEKLAKTCKAEAKGKKRAPVPAIVKSLKTAAQQIAKALPAADSPEVRATAEAILLIDDSIEGLHQILGEEKTPAGWRNPDDAKALLRRAEIQAALIKARRIMPEITVTEDTDPILKEIYGTGCTKAASNGFSVWSRWSPEKLKRVVRETLRAIAVSNFLMTGDLKVPPLVENALILDNRKDYDRAIDISLARAWITDKHAGEARKMGAFYPERTDLDPYLIGYRHTEADAEAAMLFSCTEYTGVDEMCPPLRVGQTNWVCLSYLGTPMPGVAWTEDVGEKRQRRTASGGDPTNERKEILRLGEAGLAGSRSWLAYLASHGEDPPFSNSIVDQDGKIEGNDRLKCTFVVEYLLDHNDFLWLAAKTRLGQRANFEEAWGSFAAFEARWRRWLLPARPSIVERLDPPKARALTPSETDVLARLNEHRRRCFRGSICGDPTPSEPGDTPADIIEPYLEVTLDDGLADGTRKHALYLGKHPEQLAAWPDAHEEWPDKDGFTPEGGWAGTHAVIAPGVRNADDSLSGWLGTFYHRLPLIHPGLMRIGWALENQVAVLDCGSLSRPLSGPWHVIWPYDGMQNVPTHFAPELPNPVPGLDQAAFGYPVTLQIGDFRGDATPPTIELELRETSEKGHEIACHVSTPSKPSNPDLALPDAWCLIPKAPLKPATTYFATAKWSNNRKIAWTFKTAK